MSKNNTEYISIDFGTTKSILTYATATSPVEIYGECPTAILFSDEVNRFVTPNSFNIQNSFEFGDIWQYFKLDMGKEVVDSDRRLNSLPDGASYPTPHFLAALIFRELRRQLLEGLYGKTLNPQEIEAKLDLEENGPVIITVPAESDFMKRQATVFAARVAGFRDISILEEPVAAYLYHFYKPGLGERLKQENKTLVIDFGGGTCDMAIVKMDSNKNMPVVLATKTVKKQGKDIGGKDIDTAIVTRWIETNQIQLGENNDNTQIENDIRAHLLQNAVKAKLMMNPIPKDHVQKEEMLRHPMKTKRYSKFLQDDYITRNAQKLSPSELSPDDMEEIWTEFEEAIKHDLKLLINEAQFDYVILAGGSSYLRQFINSIRIELSINDLSERPILICDEPEKAIAYGALEYLRSGKQLSTVLPMSVYLEVDYNGRDISPIKRKICGIEFIHYNNKFYLELARKNDPIDNHRSLFMDKPKHRLSIPIKSKKQKLSWKIIQVRQTENNGKDFTNINSDCISYNMDYEMQSSILSGIINFRYSFDEYGDITIRIEPYPIPKPNLITQWDSEKVCNFFDWRDTKKILFAKNEYFKSGRR